MSDLLLAAPFQQFIPPPHVNPEKGETLESKVSLLKSKYRSLDFVKAIQTYGTAEQYVLAKEADTVTRERLCCGLSMFDTILSKIKSYLVPDNSQLARQNNVLLFDTPENGILQTHEVFGFHKFWSALMFVLIAKQSKTTKNPEISDENLYGDSIYWAAGTIIQILDQERLFNAFDFTYHVRQVFTMDLIKNPIDDENFDILTKDNISLGQFQRRAYTVKSLMDEIFSTIKRVLSQGNDGSNKGTPGDLTGHGQITVFKPPKYGS